MQCSSCSAALPEGGNFCPACGQKAQPGSLLCDNCHQPIRPGLKFCTSCGTPVAVAFPQQAVSTPAFASTSYSPPTTHPEASQPSPEDERRRKGIPPLLFWIPFGLLLLLSIALLWGAGGAVVAWATFGVVFILLFVLRARFLASGAVFNLLGWLGITLVLFLTFAFTLPSGNGQAGAATGRGIQPSVPPPTSAPKAGAPTQAPTPAARPTATTVKMDPPALVKPLIFSAAKPANQVQYQVYLDGDRSYASLSYNISAGTRELSNWMGDTSWLANIYFYLGEERAKSHLQSQLKTTREDTGFVDNLGVFTPRTESTLGKGDEGYGFTRSWKDQPQAAMSTFIVRQGASWFYISTSGDTKSPAVPGDGIDLLLGELKKIDNRALIASATSGNPPAATQPTVRPNPSPTAATAAPTRVQSFIAGIGIDQTQKIQKAGNSLKPDTEEIAFSIELMDVAQETAVDIQLFYLPTGDSIKGPTQRLLPSQGLSRVGFVFSRPDRGWPTGQYRAVSYLNGREAAAVDFTVQP
ncbi:MAG: zinc ribbon domain-containing protein [Chloroflexota bacterium]